ncbi:DUF945 family protein [Psychromonas sp. MME2]|uniref:DUF945 family protein n=1 Tax=unclassified Psychromonas TaxID=2614957 RepID=UPI00339BE067
MKKLILGIAAIFLLLLTGIYWVGVVAERETVKMFALKQQPGSESKLIRYHRGFFTATSESEVKMVLDDGQDIVFHIFSSIQHYPYKALIKNKLVVKDELLNNKVVSYFGREDWLVSEDEIDLFGQLSGRLMVPSGRFESTSELFLSQPLQLDYQFNLDDYSGTVDVILEGLESRGQDTGVTFSEVKFHSNFNLLEKDDEYEYLVEIAKMTAKQAHRVIRVEEIKWQGKSYLSDKGENINSDNELSMGRYQIGQDNSHLFTDSRIKINVKGLSAAAFERLTHDRVSEQDIARTLSDLFAYGVQLTIADLSSQTPWGAIDGGLDLTLQEGAVLTEVLGNPFMLLDYVTGSINLQLPEKILQQSDLKPLLRAALQAGFLREEGQSLHFQTQLQLGELTVNGHNIPL